MVRILVMGLLALMPAIAASAQDVSSILRQDPSFKDSSNFEEVQYEQMQSLANIDPSLMNPIALIALPGINDSPKVVELASRAIAGKFKIDFAEYISSSLLEKSKLLSARGPKNPDDIAFVSDVRTWQSAINRLLLRALAGDKRSQQIAVQLGRRCASTPFLQDAIALGRDYYRVRYTLAEKYGGNDSPFDRTARSYFWHVAFILGALNYGDAEKRTRDLAEAFTRNLAEDDRNRREAREARAADRTKPTERNCRNVWVPESVSLGERRPGEQTVGGFRSVEECD